MEKKIAYLAVLGAGPGGYVAAIRAAKLGLKTILIEKGQLGGVCLNTGCIPTKALHHVSRSIDEIKKSSIFGVNTTGLNIDFKKIMERKDFVVNAQRKGIQYHLSKNKVELIPGRGKLTDTNKIMVTNDAGENIEITAKNIIIATGSSAKSIPPFDFTKEGILDNVKILSLMELPSSILIVGAGVIGCEFANIFATLGSKVTLIEVLPRILATEDEDVSKVIHKNFLKKGINVYLNTIAQSLDIKDNKYICNLNNGESLAADKIMVAIGRSPNTYDIGIEDLGIITDRNFIKVDSHLRTNIPSIYAIGDVIGGYLLAHVASKEGKVAAENIAGKEMEMDYKVIPWTIFTSPEIGTVGLNKKQAAEKNLKIRVGVFPFMNSGKAHISAETEGFVKIVSEKSSGEILGAQIIGPRASDLIHEISVAMKSEMTIEGLADSVYSHPTLSEAIMEAAEDYFGLATHISR
ncbi:MAG: dihydrolipoyl dehydrogenase [Actinobacteria bacterium]|nr:dihydrolipoyl dehydrogenase [Actinomycetota bacterium]MCL6086950.1 dihydrolipoyl dehydrogenase [Actinomycetota bacterium]